MAAKKKWTRVSNVKVAVISLHISSFSFLFDFAPGSYCQNDIISLLSSSNAGTGGVRFQGRSMTTRLVVGDGLSTAMGSPYCLANADGLQDGGFDFVWMHNNQSLNMSSAMGMLRPGATTLGIARVDLSWETGVNVSTADAGEYRCHWSVPTQATETLFFNLEVLGKWSDE